MNQNSTQPPEEQGELAHADDTVIGKAVRWSLLGFVAIAVVAGGILVVLKRRPAPLPPKITQLNAPTVPKIPNAEIPVARFTDITKEAGISFVHNNGAYGDKLLPETMGGGVAFFDFDNDGAPDLLFINSTYWPWHVPEGKTPTTAALYRSEEHTSELQSLAYLVCRL